VLSQLDPEFTALRSISDMSKNARALTEWKELEIHMSVPSQNYGRAHARREQAQTRANLSPLGVRTFYAMGWRRGGGDNCGRCRLFGGALYSNFDGKEELFLAVIHEQEVRRFEVFRSILNQESSSKEIEKMRDTLPIGLLTGLDRALC